ncbi:MAG: response regulator [Chloroflexi bacterium]|nr:response regulator [Chloroflexota bacterium]
MDLTTDVASWRVLVIDDEPDNLRLIVDLLEFSGAKAVQAPSGAKGLELLDEFKPNLILLDLSMPEMDGWTVYRKIRERPDGQERPIVALTALVMYENIERAKTEGFNSYITKPFQVRALLTQLKDCVRAFVESKSPSTGHS